MKKQATRLRSIDLRQALRFEIVRYLLVGGSMALLAAALLWLFVSVSGLPASVMSVCVILVVGPLTYLAHRNYTFRSENSSTTLEAGAFMGVVLMNYPLNLAVIFVSVDLLGLHPFAGGLLANVLPPIVNYILHTRVVFAQRGPREGS